LCVEHRDGAAADGRTTNCPPFLSQAEWEFDEDPTVMTSGIMGDRLQWEEEAEESDGDYMVGCAGCPLAISVPA